MNTALAVLDSGDNVIIVAPYYFSHKLSCQLVAANVTVCPFDPSTFAPNWEALTILVKDLQPRMVSPHYILSCVLRKRSISTLPLSI